MRRNTTREREGMIEAYRFLKTKNLITYFAKVCVEFIENTESKDIKSSIDLYEADRHKGEKRIEQAPDWYDAAISGVNITVNFFLNSQKEQKGGEIIIRRLAGTVTDTTVDTVECAATIAAFKTLFPKEELPNVSEERPWKIQF